MVNHHLHLMTTWLQGVLVQPASKLVLDAASIWKGQMRSWNTRTRYVVLKCPWLGFAMHRLLDELTLARTASTALLEPDQFYSQIFPQSYPFTPEVTNFLAWKSYASSISFASLSQSEQLCSFRASLCLHLLTSLQVQLGGSSSGVWLVQLILSIFSQLHRTFSPKPRIISLSDIKFLREMKLSGFCFVALFLIMVCMELTNFRKWFVGLIRN